MMLRTIAFLFSIICAVTCICMDDWTRHGDSCYYFAHLPSMRVTWVQAEQACAWNESHLVIIDTKEENDFIKRHLAELTPNSDEQFWTYGNDIHTENIWNWGISPNPITTSFWYPGEPNQNAGEEDCLAFYANYNFAWNDEHCDRPEYYICEQSDYYDGGNSIIG